MWAANWLLKAVKSNSGKPAPRENYRSRGESCTCRARSEVQSWWRGAIYKVSAGAGIHSLCRSSPAPLNCLPSSSVQHVPGSSFSCASAYLSATSPRPPLLRSNQPAGLCGSLRSDGPPHQELEVIKQPWCNPYYADSASSSRPSSTSLPPSLRPLPQGAANTSRLASSRRFFCNLRGAFFVTLSFARAFSALRFWFLSHQTVASVAQE